MRYREEEKTMWVEDWQRSGKSAWIYAKENGLNPQTLVRWTRRKTENKKCFVEVPAVIIPPVVQSHEILIEKGDVKIHIPLSIGSGELRMIFGMLGSSV
jgi:hypothetical protein